MNTPTSWFSEKTKQHLNLEKVSREELISELIYTKKEYNDLLGDWEKEYENKRRMVESILKTLGTFGINVFDEKEERKNLEVFFDVLFCEGE